MKLQKQLSRKVGDKEYIKWVIVLPPSVVKKLGWRESEELETKIVGKKLLITKKS